MLLKTLDLYIGLAGAASLIFVLGIVIYSLRQAIIRRNLVALLLFISFGLLLYFKPTYQILVIAALAIVYIVLVSTGYFAIKSFYLKTKLTKNPPAEYPRISILIPAKNEGRVIKESLLSVSRLDYPHSKFEIIVIDDGSTDDTYQIISSLSHIKNLRIVHHPTSHGKANSINEALNEITSEYVVILDADHLIDKRFLKRAVQDFYRPDIVCVQGKNMVRNGKASLLSRLVELEYEERYELIFNGRSSPHFVGSGAILSTRILKKIGGFSPVMLTEDFDYSYRVYLNGYKIVFDSTLKTYELAPLNIKDFFIQRHRWIRGLWQLLFYYFSDFVKTKKVSFFAKIELSITYWESSALVSLLFLNILCLFDLLKFIQFECKYFVYAISLALILLYIMTIVNYHKLSRLILLPFIPFYYILYAAPNLMAMIDNWLLKSEYKWNKTDRSAVKDLGEVLIKEEVAAGYNET
ncbi:MAG: glycosyltransferase family 2 protein [Firmicutes bacterium]|nr:glycosyltransferase family 2 protein [Bacillota bacterium]